MEFGETSQDARIREVREELGAELTEPRLLGVFADNGVPLPVEWREVDDGSEAIPLYPSGIGALVRQAAAKATKD